MISPFRTREQVADERPEARSRIRFRISGATPALVLGLILLFGLSAACAAAEPEAESPPAEAQQQSPDEPAELNVPGVGGINVTHSYLSTAVENLSQRIDRFFGEDRIYEESTGTYVQARGSVIYGRGGEFDFEGKFRAKVDFPQLEEKIHLVIESDNDEDDLESRNRITTGTNSLLNDLEDKDVSAAIQYIITEKRRWQLSLRPGLKFSNPIETFVKLRFSRYQYLTDIWLSRGTIEVGYYSERGWENEWKLELERDFGTDNFFRSTSSVLWREDLPGNQLLTQAFLVTHIINLRKSVAFEVGTTAETRPHLRDLSYFSSVRYRRDIHRGWLFFEIKPQVIFARDNDYDADPALVLTLEALIGGQYLK